MKIAKRVLCTIISLVICLSAVSVCAGAVDNSDVTPVILISGFGATTLAIDGEPVFPPTMDKLKEAFGLEDTSLLSIIDLIKRFKAEDGVVVELSAAVRAIMEPLRMNDDGTSYYDVEPIVSGAENTSLAAFKANGTEAYVPYTGSEFLDMGSIGEKIGDENVFNFTYDWRLDYNVIADELRDYIDDVLDLTGAEKVSIYCISQGGMVVGQYLYKYSDLALTDKVIFDTPVLGGASFVADLFEDNLLTLDYGGVFALVSDILHIEADLSWIAEKLPAQLMSDVINYGRSDLIFPPVMTSPAFWEMIPPEYFETLSDRLLDSEINEEVISSVTDFHSGFMSNITETFEEATANGSTVSIKVCTGRNLVTNTDAYSDFLVDMKYSCGAICADYGETFADSYTQAVENGHNSISPDRTIDLSDGYWPDRTWVINGLFHGQVEWCQKSLALVETLLYTDELDDAYSSFEFPQFMESSAPTSDISLCFNNTNCLFLSVEEQSEYSITVTNTSKKHPVFIKDIVAGDESISIDSAKSRIILPQESLELKVVLNGAVTDELYDSLKVTYISADKPTKEAEKSFGFTVLTDYSGATESIEAPSQPSVIRIIFEKIVELFVSLLNKQ